MNAATVSRSVQVLLLLFLLFAGIWLAKPFLVPIVISGILATLMLPIAKRMEERGVKKGLAAFLCVLMLLLLAATIVSLLIWQISGLSNDMTNMQEYINRYFMQIRDFIHTRIGLPTPTAEEMANAAPTKTAVQTVMTMVGSVVGILVTTILILVYTFLFIYMRAHIKQFIIKLVEKERRAKALEMVDDSSQVAQRYVSGMGKMIVFLWIMYSIGFSIVGVKYAIFFAVLCGVLEIIPFIGNIIGNGLTLLMALSQGADGGQLLGIVVTYGVIQFIQSYILEPMVVGSQVRLNALSTISAIILGQLIWGIPGMILAVPLMGMAKIVFDNVENLKPYGYLIGDDKKEAPKSILVTVKGWFQKE